MTEQNSGAFPSTKQLTNASRDRYAQHLTRIAVELDDHSKRLRTSSDHQLPIAAMRAAMSKAGDLLLALLGHGEIAAPSELPPWLRWRAIPETHRVFTGWRGEPFLHAFTPTPDIDQVLRSHSANMSVAPNGCIGHQYGSDVTPMHDRLIFVEAVAGWLGQRCEPPPKVDLPTACAILGPKDPAARLEETVVEVVVDWDGSTIEKSALRFMELGPACATACRHLAEELQNAKAAAAAQVDSGHASAVVKAYEQAKANWLRHFRVTPEIGHEPARMMVQVGDIEVESYPRMDGSSLMTLLTHPAANQIEQDAIALANASHDLGEAFERDLLVGADARHLAAQLRDLPRRPTPEMLTIIAKVDATVRNMPIAESEAPQPRSEFLSVAVETIDLATRIVKLRSSRLPEWFAHLHRHTPPEYQVCRRQVRNASFVLMYLRHDLAGVASGNLSTRTALRLDAAREHSAEEGRRVEAEVRAELQEQIAEATLVYERGFAAVSAIDEPQRQWEQRERQAWLNRDMDRLRAALPKFRRLFATYRGDIAAVADPKDIKLGRLGADFGSGCEALEIFGIAVLQERMTSEFDGVDPDQIRIAVEREIGHVAVPQHPAPEPTKPAPPLLQSAATADASSEKPNGSPTDRVQINRFYRRGDFWEVGFGEGTAHIKNVNGMGYIAQLLDQPGRPMHTWTLRNGEPPPVMAADEMTDPQTIAAAKERVAELEEMRETAHDMAERDRHEDDIRKLRMYLSATESRTSGPKRRRPMSNSIELNRSTVGKAIVAAIRAIKKQLPELGIHLETHLRSPQALAPVYTPPADTPIWHVAA